MRTTAVPHRRPTGRVNHVACRWPKAAHTEAMLNTDAVFHAPMFALNAENEPGEPNACKPNQTRSTPTESAKQGHMGAQV